MPSEILLIRHGQSTHNAEFDASGIDPLHFDAGLSPLGWRQVQDARHELAKHPAPDVVLCSPLRRAIQTAVGLFQGLDVPVEITAMHRERQCNCCDVGRSPSVLAAEFPSLSFDGLDEHWWHRGDLDERGVAVEPRDEFLRRIDLFRGWLLARPERIVVVIGHGAFFHRLAGRPFANCEIVRWMPSN